MLVFPAVFALGQEPVAPPPEGECFPECSPGYLCHDGACIEACNPACAASERCNAERVCVARDPMPVAVLVPTEELPGSGQICAYRVRRFAASALKFHLAVDDRRMVVLANGSYGCFDIPAGAHVLDLSTPTAGVGAATIRVTQDVEIAPGSISHFQAAISDGIFSPAMYLTPLDATDAAAQKKKLKLARP